jgi:hypothetical protein
MMSVHARRPGGHGLVPLKNVNLPPTVLEDHRRVHRTASSNNYALLILVFTSAMIVYYFIYATFSTSATLLDNYEDRIYKATGLSVPADTVSPTDTDARPIEEAEHSQSNEPATVTHTAPLNNSKPIVIAHAVSLITCHKAARVKGFLDAFIILRHSIHQNSVHVHPNSKYSYQMYVIIHQDGGCAEYADHLRRLGYIPIIKPTPVDISQLPEGYYKSHVENENCCGSKEFIKLYAYTLTDHPIVVHWDLDTAVLQPMDDLYDAMLFDKDSPEGQAARSRLALQRPLTVLPDRIEAFITRDVTSAAPWEKVQAVQGGFVVARSNPQLLEMYKEFINKADYVGGRGPGSGWGGLGYGGFQGAMAYQGVLAYFYDIIYPGHHVELDVCRWNQVVADVIWRGPSRVDLNGTCRDYPPDGDLMANTPEAGKCYDCRILPLEETMTVHYTACKKPWECTVPYPRVPRDKAQVYRLSHLTNVTTCGLLFERYFTYRQGIEDKMKAITGSDVSKRDGKYFPEYFKGYCQRSSDYISMDNIPQDFDFKQVYGF